MVLKSKSDLSFNPENIAVLVVDDHPQMRKAMLRIFDGVNFGSLFESATGSEAIKILKETPIDIVICDLYLHDVSGFDVLEYIRNREVNADIPVIVVTGEASKDEIVKAADRGANDYLLKPFKPDDLQQKTVQLLNAYFNPGELTKLIRLSERAFVTKDFKTSLTLVNQALSKDEHNITAKHLKALILSKLNQEDLAIKLHQENIEENPSYYRSYAALGEIYIARRQYTEAMEAIEKELELNSKQPKRQTQLATLLLDAGKIDAAINHYREALKENVKYMHALFGMGKAYAAMGNLEKAIYYYKRVRRYFPTNSKSLEAIVKCCLEAGEPKRAEFALRDERNSNKTRLDTYLVLAKFYLSVNEREKATATIDELLILKPDYPPALKLKALIFMRFEDIKSALQIYEKLIEIEDDAETRIQIAEIYMRTAAYDTAIKHLEMAVTKKPQNLNAIHARLAACYFHLQQFQKSIGIIGQIEKTGPLSDTLKKLREDCRAKLPPQNKQLAS